MRTTIAGIVIVVIVILAAMLYAGVERLPVPNL